MPYGYSYFYFDYTPLLFMLPALLISLWAQFQVKSRFAKYSRVQNFRGMTASQVARQILDRNGLTNVAVSRISGNLTDHFDPTSNTVRLSDSVADSTSVAAIGVAAHECGHAVQYANQYAPMQIRAAIIPVCNFGSKLSMPLILIGCIFSMETLITAGIILYSTLVFFQLVTLPVEFNASRRALAIIDEYRILQPEEMEGAKKVLSAAAMTYVAAMLTALLQLIRLILIFGGNRRRD